VHSSLLDNPGLHQNRLHRRRSTQPWDFALGLTMHPRQRGHPPCPKFRSVSRRLVRVSKDRPFTVFKPRSPLPLPRRRGRFGDRLPAALSFRLRGFSPPWRLTLPRPSPNFRRSSSLGVHDVSCSAPPHSPSRGPTLRSLAPRMQRTESMPKHPSSRAHVTRRVSSPVHRQPCPLVLGLLFRPLCVRLSTIPRVGLTRPERAVGFAYAKLSFSLCRVRFRTSPRPEQNTARPKMAPFLSRPLPTCASSDLPRSTPPGLTLFSSYERRPDDVHG